MESNIVSLLSIVVAVVAVWVATWQVHASSKSAERSNALPVLSEIFGEWRSTEFRMSIKHLLSETPDDLGNEGFESLPTEWREHAYKVCYFLDYLGVLTTLGIIDEEVIISMMGTRLIQVWRVIEPYIMAEREFRLRAYPSDAPPGFLVYYEHLVRRTVDLGGHDAAMQIQRREGVQHLAKPLIESEAFANSQDDADDLPAQT
jgi:hypothetical protein